MCFRASVLLRKASALKRIDVRYGPQNALGIIAFMFHYIYILFTHYAADFFRRRVKLFLN